MLKRVTPPTLSANEARTRSMIAREVLNRPVPTLSTDDEAAELSLQPLPQGAAPSMFSDPHWLEFEWAGARLAVELPAKAVDAWLRGLLGAAVPATLSAAWRESAIVRGTGLLLKALGSTRRGKARLVAHGPSLESAPPTHAFDLMLRYPSSGEIVHGRLHLDGLGLLLAGGVVADLPPLPATSDWQALPVPMRLSIGTTTLPVALLRTLGPGDVVLVTHRLVQDDDHLLLNVQTPAAVKGVMVQLAGMQLTVVDTVRNIMLDTTDETGHTEEFSWDDLPIRLTFDLGEKTLTLHDLQRLQPGETMPLDRALDRCVTIRANGAVIGSGELVDIDGRLGVSVVSLNAAGQEGEARQPVDDEWQLPDDED